jgi:hypothetical protein
MLSLQSLVYVFLVYNYCEKIYKNKETDMYLFCQCHLIHCFELLRHFII